MSLFTWLQRQKVKYQLRSRGICHVHLTKMHWVIKGHGWYSCQECTAEAQQAYRAATNKHIEEWKRLTGNGRADGITVSGKQRN